jgi:predicted TIM-barrel fold metal-dependent hydrolase
MWFATQPVEEPDNPAELVETIMHYSGEDRTVFASDWPHHDFDHPQHVFGLPFPPAARRAILGGNGARFYGIDIPAEYGAP